jgi:ribosomal protein S4
MELLKDEPKASVEWLEKKRAVAKVLRLPVREDIKENINEQLVVEHYSR